MRQFWEENGKRVLFLTVFSLVCLGLLGGLILLLMYWLGVEYTSMDRLVVFVALYMAADIVVVTLGDVLAQRMAQQLSDRAARVLVACVDWLITFLVLVVLDSWMVSVRMGPIRAGVFACLTCLAYLAVEKWTDGK
ncbi:MAG: YrvL family regulatory protein [Eubacteriales bacterium]|jgi:hypothetical protein